MLKRFWNAVKRLFIVEAPVEETTYVPEMEVCVSYHEPSSITRSESRYSHAEVLLVKEEKEKERDLRDWRKNNRLVDEYFQNKALSKPVKKYRNGLHVVQSMAIS